MLPKNEHPAHGPHHQQKAPMIKVAPAAHQVTTLTGGVSAARAAVQQFLATELGAREIRITKIAPQDHGLDGWAAEAEILVPNLEVKMLGLPLTQEVLECEHYAIELEPDLSVRSYGHLGPESD